MAARHPAGPESPGDFPAFIGASCTRAEAGGFCFGHWTTHVWGEAVESHGHEDAHLMLVTAGAYDTRADGDRAAALIYNPPGVWHADRFVDGPGSFFTVSLSPRRYASFDEVGVPDTPTRLDEHAFSGLLIRLMRAAEGGWPTTDLEKSSLCLEVMAAVARQEAGEQAQPRWLGQACELLRERAIGDIDAVSGAVGVHPVHLARTFRKFLRCTPGEYRLAHQVRSAAAALARGRAPLAQIALDAGFADQSHFTRRFHAVYGLPPSQYRRRLGRGF